MYRYCFPNLITTLGRYKLLFDFSTGEMQNAVEQPPKFVGSWVGTYTINVLVVVWILVVGFGFGGWASMVNFIHQIDTFGFFTKCYQCPSPPPLEAPQLNATAPPPLHHSPRGHRL